VRSLVLFDIDATLLKTDGAGVAAMGDAGRLLFGPSFHTRGLDFAGRLDTLIFRELFEINCLDRTPQAERELRQTYRGCLVDRLARSPNAAALPGAIALVQAVRQAGAFEIGLLTGNFQETGSLKLAACGLDPAWFTISAWGDDSPHDPPAREHLPPVALRRYRERTGSDLPPGLVTIIGDTPHDVRCAAVNGCRCIAVATGKFSERELASAGADWVVPDLTDTRVLLQMLAGGPPDRTIGLPIAPGLE
jgi:phosphoglycolate phosphatase-like HAD superfamily hydrolase